MTLKKSMNKRLKKSPIKVTIKEMNVKFIQSKRPIKTRKGKQVGFEPQEV